MKFENLKTELIIDDKLYLGSIELSIIFTENPEVQEIVDDCFETKTRLSAVGKVATKTIPLNEDGKKFIKSIVNKLSLLDKAFAERSSLLEEFKDLLK